MRPRKQAPPPKRSSRKGFGVVAVCLLGCVALAKFMTTGKATASAPLRGGENESVRPRPGDPPQKTESTSAQVDSLRAELVGLRSQVHDQARALASASAPPSTPSAEREPLEPEAAARTVQARFDGMFEAQAVDPAWSRVEKQAMSDFFSGHELAGTRVDGLECRESMCRVNLHFEDDGARRAFLAHIGQPPFVHGGFYRADPETGGFTLFTAREGHPLPSFESEGDREPTH